MATMKPKGDADAARFNKAAARLKGPKRSADAATGAAVVKKRLAATAATTKNAASKKASVTKTASDAVSRRYTSTELANSGDKNLKDKVRGITRQTRPDAKNPVSYSTKKNVTNYSSKVQKKLKSKFGK